MSRCAVSRSGPTDLVQIVDIGESRFRQQACHLQEAHYRRLTDIAQEAIVQVKDESSSM